MYKIKVRHCYICGKNLDWISFKFQNFHLSLDYLKKLWNHRSVQFYCCECFKDENLWSKGVNNPHAKANLKQKKN